MSHTKAPSFVISVRFLLAVLAFIAYAVQYSQRINMSVAIVCMIKQIGSNMNESDASRNISEQFIDSSCLSLVSDGINQFNGEFNWDKRLQGLILSSYFVGYLLTNMPGGWLSFKFGSKIVLAVSIFVSSLLTLGLPFVARINVILLIACRFFIGFAHGVFWPSFSGFWAAWAPPKERSRLISISTAGAQIGNVITLSLGGYLCVKGFDGGWPSMFYIFGASGILWFFLWVFLASNRPSNNRFISKKERLYIEEQTKETMEVFKQGEKSAPLLKILTSRPAAAIFFGHASCNWGTYLFLTSLPTYMKEVLKFDIKSNGILSSLPYVALWLVIILSGIISDKLQSYKIQKITIRRIFNSLGFLIPMLAVIGLMFVTCHTKYVGVALLIIGVASAGFVYGGGFLVNYNDISGIYSGIAFGIGNTFATLPGIVAPYLVGILTKNKTQKEWQMVFGITACVYLAGAIVLILFTKVELQEWAVQKKTAEDVPLTQKEIVS